MRFSEGVGRIASVDRKAMQFAFSRETATMGHNKGADVSSLKSSTEFPTPLVSISIVSHGHDRMLRNLLADLDRLSEHSFEVILTLNIPEFSCEQFSHKFPIKIIRNSEPKGFGANHNTAFKSSRAKFFAVVNPDIRLDTFDFSAIIDLFSASSLGAAAPLVVSSDGRVQDSARRFPNTIRFLRRIFSRTQSLDYKIANSPISVDWVAGMFVIIRREAFLDIGGFDERFFLYYEDADICRRLRQRNWNILLQPRTAVIHDAQRASHRQWKHLRWHIVSAARFLFFSK
jgi:GT2 family glycosyltransferase